MSHVALAAKFSSKHETNLLFFIHFDCGTGTQDVGSVPSVDRKTIEWNARAKPSPMAKQITKPKQCDTE